MLMQLNSQIRDLRSDDDFGAIVELIREKFQQYNRQFHVNIKYAQKPDLLKASFFPNSHDSGNGQDLRSIGFVSEAGGFITAFMGVNFSESSKNGYLISGFRNQHEPVLTGLLAKCLDTVKQNGGTKLYQFVPMLPGQIRNEEIAFWERLGFVSDPYFHALIKLDMDEWNVPEDLDPSMVTPGGPDNFQDVLQILREDSMDQLADEFSEQYAKWSPDKILLLLKDPSSCQIIAFSYYRVAAFKDRSESGKSYDGLGAWGFGIHFRPSASFTRCEKRRFIQCTLASMKQLNVIFTSSRVSSRDFDTLIELLAQGFDFQSRVLNARLSKDVPS